MNKKSTMPTIQNTLKFCLLLLDEELLLESDNAITWTREVRTHRENLENLQRILKESESDIMEMSQKSYEKAEKVFGKSLAARLFKDVKIVSYYVPPVNAEKLFADIKSKSETASRTKEVKQPTGFFTENAGKAFEAALFGRNGTNGHKGMPTMATSFAELQQAKIEGELSTWFLELSNNILLSSEFSPAVKAEKLAALTAEYAKLSKGGN